MWNLVFAILIAYLIIKLCGWLVHQKLYDPKGTARRIIEARKD